jgi:NAD(P)H-hydrate epimerase
MIEDVLHKYDVISIGCGLGLDNRTVQFVDRVLNLICKAEKPVVIDADGINALSVLGRTNLPSNAILTPHDAELARLLKVDVKEVPLIREGFVREVSKKYSCTTVLKGHNSLICSKNLDILVNQSGNSALAKAGSGDVLTGVIAGLIAQGVSSYDAAVLGVYLHGLTGEMASEGLSEYCVLASDLLNFIPKAVKKSL